MNSGQHPESEKDDIDWSLGLRQRLESQGITPDRFKTLSGNPNYELLTTEHFSGIKNQFFPEGIKKGGVFVTKRSKKSKGPKEGYPGPPTQYEEQSNYEDVPNVIEDLQYDTSKDGIKELRKVEYVEPSGRRTVYDVKTNKTSDNPRVYPIKHGQTLNEQEKHKPWYQNAYEGTFGPMDSTIQDETLAYSSNWPTDVTRKYQETGEAPPGYDLKDLNAVGYKPWEDQSTVINQTAQGHNGWFGKVNVFANPIRRLKDVTRNPVNVLPKSDEFVPEPGAKEMANLFAFEPNHALAPGELPYATNPNTGMGYQKLPNQEIFGRFENDRNDSGLVTAGKSIGNVGSAIGNLGVGLADFVTGPVGIATAGMGGLAAGSIESLAGASIDKIAAEQALKAAAAGSAERTLLTANLAKASAAKGRAVLAARGLNLGEAALQGYFTGDLAHGAWKSGEATYNSLTTPTFIPGPDQFTDGGYVGTHPDWPGAAYNAAESLSSAFFAKEIGKHTLTGSGRNVFQPERAAANHVLGNLLASVPGPEQTRPYTPWVRPSFEDRAEQLRKKTEEDRLPKWGPPKEDPIPEQTGYTYTEADAVTDRMANTIFDINNPAPYTDPAPRQKSQTLRDLLRKQNSNAGKYEIYNGPLREQLREAERNKPKEQDGPVSSSEIIIPPEILAQIDKESRDPNYLMAGSTGRIRPKIEKDAKKDIKPGEEVGREGEVAKPGEVVLKPGDTPGVVQQKPGLAEEIAAAVPKPEAAKPVEQPVAAQPEKTAPQSQAEKAAQARLNSTLDKIEERRAFTQANLESGRITQELADTYFERFDSAEKKAQDTFMEETKPSQRFLGVDVGNTGRTTVWNNQGRPRPQPPEKPKTYSATVPPTEANAKPTIPGLPQLPQSALEAASDATKMGMTGQTKSQFADRNVPNLNGRQAFEKNNGMLSRLTYDQLKDLHDTTVADPGHNPKFAAAVRDEMGSRERKVSDTYSTNQEGRNAISSNLKPELMTDADLKNVTDNHPELIKRQREIITGHNRGDFNSDLGKRSAEAEAAIRKLNELKYQLKFAREEANKRVRAKAGVARPDGTPIVASTERKLTAKRYDPVTGEEVKGPVVKRNPVQALNHARGDHGLLSRDELVAARDALKAQGRDYYKRIDEDIRKRDLENERVHKRLHGSKAAEIPNPRTMDRAEIDRRLAELPGELKQAEERYAQTKSPEDAKHIYDIKTDLSGLRKEAENRDTLESQSLQYDRSKNPNYKQVSGDIQGRPTKSSVKPGVGPFNRDVSKPDVTPIEGRDPNVIRAEGAAAYEAENQQAARTANQETIDRANAENRQTQQTEQTAPAEAPVSEAPVSEARQTEPVQTEAAKPDVTEEQAAKQETVASINDNADILDNMDSTKEISRILNGTRKAPGLVEQIRNTAEDWNNATSAAEREVARKKMQDHIDELTSVRDDLQDRHDNTPESLQGTDAYDRREDMISELDEAISGLEEQMYNMKGDSGKGPFNLTPESNKMPANVNPKRYDINAPHDERVQWIDNEMNGRLEGKTHQIDIPGDPDGQPVTVNYRAVDMQKGFLIDGAERLLTQLQDHSFGDRYRFNFTNGLYQYAVGSRELSLKGTLERVSRDGKSTIIAEANSPMERPFEISPNGFGFREKIEGRPVSKLAETVLAREILKRIELLEIGVTNRTKSFIEYKATDGMPNNKKYNIERKEGNRTYTEQQMKSEFIGRIASSNPDIVKNYDINFISKDDSYTFRDGDTNESKTVSKTIHLLEFVPKQPNEYGKKPATGTIYVEIDNSKPTEAYLSSSYLDDAVRGQKIGTAMYSELAERLRSMGVKKLNGYVIDGAKRPNQIRQRVVDAVNHELGYKEKTSSERGRVTTDLKPDAYYSPEYESPYAQAIKVKIDNRLKDATDLGILSQKDVKNTWMMEGLDTHARDTDNIKHGTYELDFTYDNVDKNGNPYISIRISRISPDNPSGETKMELSRIEIGLDKDSITSREARAIKLDESLFNIVDNPQKPDTLDGSGILCAELQERLPILGFNAGYGKIYAEISERASKVTDLGDGAMDFQEETDDYKRNTTRLSRNQKDLKGGRTYTDAQMSSEFIGRVASQNKGITDGHKISWTVTNSKIRSGGRIAELQLINEKTGRSVGQIHLQIRAKGKSIYLAESHLDSDLRGKNLGTLMYSEMAERIRAMGFNKLEGYVIDENRRPNKIRNKIIDRINKQIGYETRTPNRNGVIETELKRKAYYSPEYDAQGLDLKNQMGSEALDQRYRYLTPGVKSVALSIEAGNKTVADILNQMAEQGVNKGDDGFTPDEGKLARLLLKHADDTSLSSIVRAIDVSETNNGQRYSMYNPAGPLSGFTDENIKNNTFGKIPNLQTGSVTVSRSHLESPNLSMRVVLHEITHAVTVEKVNRAIFGLTNTFDSGNNTFGESGAKYVDRIKAYIKDPNSDKSVVKIARSYLKLLSTLDKEIDSPISLSKANRGTSDINSDNVIGAGMNENTITEASKKGLYGSTNIAEFISEAMTNPDFQARLSTIKMGETSVWANFKKSVAEMLGIAEGDTALAHTMDGVMEVASKRLELFHKPGESYKDSLQRVREQRFQSEGDARPLQRAREERFNDDFNIDALNDDNLAQEVKSMRDLDADIKDLKRPGHYDKAKVDNLERQKQELVNRVTTVMENSPHYDEAVKNVGPDASLDDIINEINHLDAVAKRGEGFSPRDYQPSAGGFAPESNKMPARNPNEGNRVYTEQQMASGFIGRVARDNPGFKKQFKIEFKDEDTSSLPEPDDMAHKIEMENEYNDQQAAMEQQAGDTETVNTGSNTTSRLDQESYSGDNYSEDLGFEDQNYNPGPGSGPPGARSIELTIKTKQGDYVGQINVSIDEAKPNVAYLSQSSIEGHMQGQGIGKLMYSEMAERLRSKGITELTGWIADSKLRPNKIRQRIIDAVNKDLGYSDKTSMKKESISSALRPEAYYSPDVNSRSEAPVFNMTPVSNRMPAENGRQFIAQEKQAAANAVQSTIEGFNSLKPETMKDLKDKGVGIVTLGWLRGSSAQLDKLAQIHSIREITEIRALLMGNNAGEMGMARGEGFHTAVSAQNKIFQNKLNNILKPFENELKLLSEKEQSAKLEEIGRAIVSNRTHPNQAIAEAVKQFRAVFKELHDYQTKAGVRLGDMGGTYMPRILKVDKVLENSEQFINAATRAYRQSGLSEAEAKTAAQDWFDNILRNDEGFSSGGTSLTFDSGMHNGEPKHTRDRVFGPDAERLMEPFYNRNVYDALTTYIGRAVKTSELTRRFGVDFSKYKDMQDRIIAKGPNGAKILGEVNTLVASQIAPSQARTKLGRVAADANTLYQSIRFLTNATLSSMSEPIVNGMRTGNVMDAITGMGNSIQYAYRNARDLAPDYHEKLAQDIGIIQAHLATSAISSSVDTRYLDANSSRFTKTTINGFFRGTGLHQWTEGTRVASVKIGETFLSRLASDIQEGGKPYQLSVRLLNELGVTDKKAMASFIERLGTMTEAERLRAISNPRHRQAQEYRQALRKYSEQVIMNPNAGTRSKLAAHPLGTFIFGLQSYTYAFHENVLKRMGRILVNEAILNKGDMSPANRMALLGAFMSAPIFLAGQYAQGEIRDELFTDPARAGDPPITVGTKIARMISRAGGFGRMDAAVNTLGAFKYDKPLETVLVGPTASDLSSTFSEIARLFKSTNSPETNTQERKTTRSVYNSVIQPAISTGASRLPGVTGRLASTGIHYAAKHPGVREAVVKGIAGRPVDPRQDNAPNENWVDQVMKELE
jgi:L-amino acid N-acyltransferase YncA